MKVLIADDHAMLRAGLINSVTQLEEKAIAYEAENAKGVMDALAAHSDLDLILLDLFMPGANGFELLSKVCDATAGAPVVVFSASEDAAHMRKALDCGAAGYIPKSAPREVMLSALRLVLVGGVYVPPDIASTPQQAQNRLGGSPPAQGPEALTTRQKDVLQLLGQGRSNKQIARTLDVSENTVKIHVAGIMRTFGARNRTEAVILAREQGFDFERS